MKYGLFLGSLIVAGAVFAIAAPSPKIAIADDAVQVAQMGPADLSKKRRALMKANGKDWSALRKAVKKGEINTRHVALAEKIAQRASQLNKEALWPKASGSDMIKSRAKPEIWKDWATFQNDLAKLEKASTAAVAAAKAGDAKALGKQLSAMGCSGCHKQFRGPRPK